MAFPRYVHGTCDKEADFVSYHRKKEAHPDYEYICLSCKNNSTMMYMKRKDSKFLQPYVVCV